MKAKNSPRYEQVFLSTLCSSKEDNLFHLFLRLSKKVNLLSSFNLQNGLLTLGKLSSQAGCETLEDAMGKRIASVIQGKLAYLLIPAQPSALPQWTPSHMHRESYRITVNIHTGES